VQTLQRGHRDGGQRVDNSIAWTLAFAPLSFVLIGAVLTSAAVPSAQLIGLGAAVGLNITLCKADGSHLKTAGFPAPASEGLIPIYLFKKSTSLRQTFAIPIIWCTALLVSLGGAGVVANTIGVQIDVSQVESLIRSGVKEQSGLAVRLVSQFRSSEARIVIPMRVTLPNGSPRMADVTVQNSDGDIVWRTH